MTGFEGSSVIRRLSSANGTSNNSSNYPAFLVSFLLLLLLSWSILPGPLSAVAQRERIWERTLGSHLTSFYAWDSVFLLGGESDMVPANDRN